MTKHFHPKDEQRSEEAKSQAEGPRAQADPATEAGVAGPEVDAANKQADEAMTQLLSELEATKDRALRCQAELENYRKRASREIQETTRYASLPLLRDLLPVLDNVERAIQAAEQNADGSALLDGIKMVQQQLEGVLKQHGCQRIEALHTPFDPHVHHAVMQQASEEHPANTVLMVTQNGYQLHDRVVRPSQVIVSKGDSHADL